MEPRPRPPQPESFDYLGNVQRLAVVMQALESVELGAIISTTECAHTLGPFVDPTMYREALQRGLMDAMADLARALQPAVAIWDQKIAPLREAAQR